MTKVKAAFRMATIEVKLDKLLPSRVHKEEVKTTARYKNMEAAVRAHGIIEPLVVFPQPGKEGHFVILDGHVRFEILRALRRSRLPREQTFTSTLRQQRLAVPRQTQRQFNATRRQFAGGFVPLAGLD